MMGRVPKTFVLSYHYTFLDGTMASFSSHGCYMLSNAWREVVASFERTCKARGESFDPERISPFANSPDQGLAKRKFLTQPQQD